MFMTAPRDNDVESDLGFLHRREGIELLERRSVPAACSFVFSIENGGALCAWFEGWKMLWKLSRSGECTCARSIWVVLREREPSKGVTSR
jgi:hypothetical protein